MLSLVDLGVAEVAVAAVPTADCGTALLAVVESFDWASLGSKNCVSDAYQVTTTCNIPEVIEAS